jgi:hypothetical protein
MSDMIADLIPSYRAVIAKCCAKYREMDGVGSVDDYVQHLTAHQVRYCTKLENIRANATDGIRAACDAADAQIASITTTEIARVRAAGVVEFAS